jgi:hypothetical protein
MKTSIKNTCSQCTEPNKTCKEMRCPLWAYHKSGNLTPLWQRSRGAAPSRESCIASTCFACKGNSKEGIENCEETLCPLWSKRKYSKSAIRKAQELRDARRCLSLEPVDEQSPIMQLIYKINGVEMYDTNEPIESLTELPLVEEKKERKKKHSHAEMEAIRKSHASVRALADKYDCSPTTIQKIKAGV